MIIIPIIICIVPIITVFVVAYRDTHTKDEYMNNAVHYDGTWGQYGHCACRSCTYRKAISTTIIWVGIIILVASLWFGLDATKIPGAAKNLLYVSMSMVGMGVGGVVAWIGAVYRER